MGKDGRSLRVRRVTFLPPTRRIYAASVRMTLGFESMRPLAPQDVASYAVRIPRARSLPSASFRFPLAADTLAVRLGVPVIKASTGTCTRPVTSRFAFAPQFQRQVMTLRVMPDARKKKQGACAPCSLRNGMFDSLAAAPLSRACLFPAQQPPHRRGANLEICLARPGRNSLRPLLRDRPAEAVGWRREESGNYFLR